MAQTSKEYAKNLQKKYEAKMENKLNILSTGDSFLPSQTKGILIEEIMLLREIINDLKQFNP